MTAELFLHAVHALLLVKRSLCKFSLNRQILDKLNGVRSPCIVQVISSVFEGLLGVIGTLRQKIIGIREILKKILGYRRSKLSFLRIK